MISIVTDSMCDLTQEEAAALQVEMLPLTVRFDEEELVEGRDISRAVFYQRLRTCEQLPKTSQVSPDTYRRTFRRLLQEDSSRTVLCITGSSKISGCYQSALMARSMLDEPERVCVVDSLIAISGQALLVRAAAAARDRFVTAQELADEVTELRDHQRTFGQAEDLKYLVMGGRLSPLVGRMGNALNIKPMLKFEGGEILQAGMVRGKDKALPWYAERLREHPPRREHPIIIAGADCPETVEKTRAYLSALPMELPPIETMGVGVVIGTHVGPGLISVSWIEQI